MKYLLISESDPEQMETVFERNAIVLTEREKNPMKYPQYTRFEQAMILGDLPKLTQGWARSITLFDGTPEQVANLEAFWTAQMPDIRVRLWWIPIVETGDSFIAEYRHSRQLVEQRERQLKATQ